MKYDFVAIKGGVVYMLCALSTGHLTGKSVETGESHVFFLNELDYLGHLGREVGEVAYQKCRAPHGVTHLLFIENHDGLAVYPRRNCTDDNFYTHGSGWIKYRSSSDARRVAGGAIAVVRMWDEKRFSCAISSYTEAKLADHRNNRELQYVNSVTDQIRIQRIIDPAPKANTGWFVTGVGFGVASLISLAAVLAKYTLGV